VLVSEGPVRDLAITVVMAVRNEERFIGGTLEQIAAQDFPKDRYEVIIVDGESEDRTIEIAESFKSKIPNLKIMTNPIHRASASRNKAFRESRGKYMIVIDGHVHIPSKSLLRDMMQIFSSSDYEVLSRPQPLRPPDNNIFQNCIASARESVIGHGLDSTIYNMEYEGEVDPASSAAMYRYSIFEAVGYIDEDFDAAEDYEFNYRIAKAGYKSYTSPKLAVYYYPRESYRGLFHQMERYGLGRFRLTRKYPNELVSGTLVPPLFFGGLLLLYILSIFIPGLVDIPLGFTILYMVAVFIASLMIVVKQSKIDQTVIAEYMQNLPFIFITIHAGLAWGYISGLLKRN